jgi:hypothetical protein
MILNNREYHPIIGVMPSPLREVPEEIGWYREEWATPYMAAVARVVFRPKPDVTLTPQVGAESIIERLGIGRTMPFIAPLIHPAMPLREQDVIPVEEKMPALTGVKPGLGEWFKENRILVIVVIIALVLLFFFLRKRRR